jgi:hypothetical protein
MYKFPVFGPRANVYNASNLFTGIKLMKPLEASDENHQQSYQRSLTANNMVKVKFSFIERGQN